MEKLTKELEEKIPGLIGDEVKKLIRRNISDYDEGAVDFAGRTIETEIRKVMGLSSPVDPENLKPKSGLNYRITGMGNTIKSILEGETVSDAVENHIGVFIEYNISF